MLVTHFLQNNSEHQQNRPLECGNSLPGSNENNSKNYYDKTALESRESKQLATVPSDIIESRLKHFFIEGIDKDICQVINDYCSYKLAQIINAANDYMTHCGRLKFTSEDFNKGLIFCGECPTADYEILLSSEDETRLKKENSKSIQKFNSKTHFVYVKEMWLNGKSPLSASVSELSDNLQNYFKVVTEVILSNNKELRSIILNDLHTNKNIIQLVPYLINFFCDAMSKFQCDFLKISVLLQYINALLRNVYLYFGQNSLLNVLSVTLLKFLAANLRSSGQGRDYWLIKETAANILAFILQRSKSQHLFFEVIYFVQSVLLTFQNSFNSHYGALVALNSIGVPAILLALPSYLPRFQEHRRKMILSSGNLNTFDSQMVQGQIIRSYHLLVNYYFKTELGKQKFSSNHLFNSKYCIPDNLQSVFPFLSQSTFSDYFGEAVLPAFPVLNFVSHSAHLKKRKNKISGNQNKKCLKNFMIVKKKIGSISKD